MTASTNFVSMVFDYVTIYSPHVEVKRVAIDETMNGEIIITLKNGEYYKGVEKLNSLIWKKSWRAREVKKIF